MGCNISVEQLMDTSFTVTIVGLDNSGKSHIVHKLTNTDGTEYVPVPTAGCEFYNLSSSSLKIIDMGGIGKYRDQWPSYIKQSDGVVFVIDKSDHIRMSRVREEIADVLELVSKLSIPILILANKSDIDQNLNEQDIASICQISQFHVQYDIKLCSAKTGEGISQGRDWLMSHMTPKQQTLQNLPI